MNPDPSNTLFQKAVAFVNQTSRHLFLTGKAGTGKTTFLKDIKENTFKKMAVVAPTGVAAINAGGVTIHSFFQLPFGPFIPGHQYNRGNYEGEINNAASLIKNLRLPATKREVIRELDLLIIDEVSMVRADLLDAMDTVMRYVRRQPLIPFGGVQMIYIGDLFQLPPVIKNEEWEVLKDYYGGPFFFYANVLKYAFPLYIELKKIYRQKDDSFIHILNNIRNNCCTASDLDFLHQYYKPGYSPAKEENYITLTSHNGKADIINQSALEQLPAPLQTFKATVTNEFHERNYPAEGKLYLKEGAQVMFIKNDKGEVRRYYNGKIATVSKIEKEKIKVVFANEPGELELERETWKNIRYKYTNEKDEVDEEELGTFTQYPIRLAWAITIHKSQGLTFEKAIIDAGASFAPGQVYVSLSRLTSLQGLVLYSRILPHTITTDQRVVEFIRNEMGEEQLQQTLLEDQKTFVRHSLINNFAWEKLVEVVTHFYDGYEQRKLPDKNKCIEWGQHLLMDITTQHQVALNFKKQLEQLFLNCEADGYKQLHTRVNAATQYFLQQVQDKLISAATNHINKVKGGAKVKKYVKELQSLQFLFARKKQQLQQALQLAGALHSKATMPQLLQLVEVQQKPSPVSTEPGEEPTSKPGKQIKGETHRQSLQLFRQGKTIEEIAHLRNLSPGTIESHLTSFVSTGEVDVLDLVTVPKLDAIVQVVHKLQTKNDQQPSTNGQKPTYNAIKHNLGNEYTFAEIRASINYIEWEKKQIAKVD